MLLNAFKKTTTALLAAAVLLGGCATRAPDHVTESEFCHNHLSGFDVTQTDRVFYRPDEQPYFALSRLHADFSPADLSPKAFSEWKTLVVDHSWQELAAAQKRSQGFAEDASRSCLVELAAITPPGTWQTYADAAGEHDLYRDWQRWAGLYPISSRVVAGRITAAQAEWQEEYGGPFDDPAIQSVTRYAPTSGHANLGPGTIATWFAQAYDDHALGLPRLLPDQLHRLLAHHAPELDLLVASGADQLGAVQVPTDPDSALVPQFVPEPISYVDSHFTRFNGTYHLQLAYTFWFPERPKESALDIYGGPWNGITWRVTLDTDGQPLWFDVIHNCGCYHQIWLPDEFSPRADVQGEEPLYLPYDWTGRPRLTLLPGTHYVRAVTSASTDDTLAVGHARPSRTEGYGFLPYSDLLALFAGDDYYVSFFDHHGMVANSQRLERYVLWPFGVKSPGAMRRSGAHTIAFVGKRHFDGPELFEQLIERR